ncbi:MAG: DNA polymerase III subunit chi [Gammaproteobacteria bacterium]|nr:DNA polymerase III subunit chi [Gammaproteobacteria bacterium]
MTRIDFYILTDTSGDNRELYACRIAEKAYQMGRKVFMHSESAEQSQRIDDMLWNFRTGSFVPHSLHANDCISGVTIGHNMEPIDNTDVLINLAQTAPVFFSRFERVAEIVDQAPQNKDSARERFRFYRDRGYELQHHNIQQ